jgi:hypothetical protein
MNSLDIKKKGNHKYMEHCGSKLTFEIGSFIIADYLKTFWQVLN